MIINIFISESLCRSCTGRLYSPSIIARHIYSYQECLGLQGGGCCSGLCANFWDCLIKVCRRKLADAEKVLGRSKAPGLCPVTPTSPSPRWDAPDPPAQVGTQGYLPMYSQTQWVQALGRQRRDEDDPVVQSWCWAPQPNTKLPAMAPPGRSSLPPVEADKLQRKHRL